MRPRLVPILVVVVGIALLTVIVGIALNLNLYLLALLIGVSVAFMLVMCVFAWFHELLARIVWPRGVIGLDDRGRGVEFRDLDEMPTRLHLTREQRKRVDRAARRRPLPAKMNLGPLILLGPPVVVLGVLWLFGIQLPTAAGWALAFVFFVLGTVALRLMRVIGMRWHNPALVVIGRCPSCGYDLTELPREDDGCVVCPECGAAWAMQHGDLTSARDP